MDDKEQWLHKKLGDSRVSTIIMGQSPSSSAYNEEGVGIPFLQGCAEFGEVFPNTTVFSADLLKIAPENSILMSVRAPVGTINKADQKYVIGRGLCSIVPVIDGDFLYYYLLQNTHELELKAQGSTFLAINSSELNEMPISYPASLPAQRRIAAILASTDKVIAATQKTIAKYKQMKQGMMEDLLKPKEDWKMVKLGECCEIITGPFGSSLHEKDYTNEGTPVINPQNIVNNKIIAIDSCLVNDETVERLSKYKMKSGDIVIARRGEMGRCAVVEANQEGWLCGTGSFAIKVHPEKLDAYFLQLQLSSNSTKIVLENNSIGATMSNLNQSILSELEIDTPSLAEQHRIAAILSGIDAKIAAEEKVLEKYEKVKKGLMERLMEEDTSINMD